MSADPTPPRPDGAATPGERPAPEAAAAFASGDRARAALDGLRRHLRAAMDELETMAGDPATGDARARAIAQLVEAERERVAFGQAAAHDLRNPLAAIRGQVQLLARRARRAEADGLPLDLARLGQAMAAIDAAVGRGTAMLAELLDPARETKTPERDGEDAPP